MKTVAFVPIKLNNRRLSGKNTKAFSGGPPLITFFLEKLLKVTEIDEFYVFCSSPSIKEFLPKGVHYLERSPLLDTDETRMNAVVSAFIQKVHADIYMFTHVTSPFVAPETLSKAIQSVMLGQHDSAVIVEKLQEFLWYNNKPLTYDLASIPRTQDLTPVFKETSGAYVFTREVALQHRRIGDTPFFVECGKIEAIDIDDATDFLIADAIFSHIYGSHK